MKRLIVTDSTSDLPASVVAQYNIKIMPVRLVLNGKTFLDREQVSAKQFYEYFHKFDTMETQAVTYEDYALALMKIVREYDEVIIIHCSSNLSETHAVAAKVITDFEGRHHCRMALIDSQLCGMGLGLVVISAARASAGGATFDEVVRRAQDMIPRVVVYIAIPTLKYLRKNNKISGLRAMLGQAMKIKPILHMKDGQLAVKSKLVGEQQSSMILKIIDEIKADVTDTPISVAISHTQDVSFVDNLRDVMETTFDCRDIFVTYFGPSIGISCGPGTAGVAYIKWHEAVL